MIRFDLFALGVATLTLLAAVSACDASGEPPAVGWQMDLSDPSFADKLSGKSLRLEKSRRDIGDNFSIEVADSVLRVTAKYGTDGANQGDNVHFDLPLGGPIDLTKYPVFEIEWRTNSPKPQGCLLVQNTAVTPTGGDSSSYYYPAEGKQNEWHTSVNQFVPDASFPTRGTPVKLNSVYLAMYGWGPPDEYTLEIRSFKIRAMNEPEAAADALKSKIYREFKPVPTPKRWTEEVFPFGPIGYCRGPEGYESWYDNAVRCHTTVSAFHYSQLPGDRGAARSVPVTDFIQFRKRELETAKLRGLYLIPMLEGLPSTMKNDGVDALPWLNEYATALGKAFKDEPYLAGWFIADEISDDYLWGIAATADALNRADPGKLVMVNHFGIERILRFEPYLNVVMTDSYPIHTHGRDPWSYAKWCRTLSEKTDKPQWIFAPAFGQSTWFETDSSYAYPTRAELRLMSYLALANGVKGLTYFLYSTPNMFPGVFDQIGNPLPFDDPIVQDISAIGEKLAEIGPFLLQTKLLPIDSASAASSSGVKGLSVGVRRLAGVGDFVVVTNESVTNSQGGTVELSSVVTDPKRRVYDLYALGETAPAGAKSFGVDSLLPGDGRIYFVGTASKFAEVRKKMLRNRALEIIRMANLDRIVAERWDMDVKKVDTQFAKARAAAGQADTKPAQAAKKMVDAILAGDSEMARCRRTLMETRAVLSKAYLAVHIGYNKAHLGCESMLDAPINLWNRFSPLQEDYYLGRKEQLMRNLEALRKEGQELLEKAQASRRASGSL